MNATRIFGWLFQTIVGVVVIALIAGQFLGQPVLLSFVETGSMEPTLEPNDGFVALPPELAGEPSEGDVVVFEAEELHDGGLTTHRIVDETDRGYITQGDDNHFTDQDNDEPPVQEADIVAVAWQPGGEVLAIPWLGTVVTAIQSGLESLQWWLAQFFGTSAFLGMQGIATLLFIASIVLYLLTIYLEDDRKLTRTVSRDTGSNPRALMVALTLVIVVGMTAAMVVPAETESFDIVSAEFESDSPTVIEQGTSESIEYPIYNDGLISTVVVLEASGGDVEAEPEQLTVERQSSENATVTMTAPEETGHYQNHVKQYRYLTLLPTPVIEGLHEIHPWAPIGVINAVVGIPFYMLGMSLLGTGRVRSPKRETSSWLP